MTSSFRYVQVLVTAVCMIATPLVAQKNKPAAKSSAPTITIAVDASEAPRKIFHAQMTIPAAPGSLTLYYPKWIPGEHGPTGPIQDLAGLKFTANGQTLKWRRDLLDGTGVFEPATVQGADPGNFYRQLAREFSGVGIVPRCWPCGLNTCTPPAAT